MEDTTLSSDSETHENDYTNSDNKRFKTCDSDSTIMDDGDGNSQNIEVVDIQPPSSIEKPNETQLNEDSLPTTSINDEMIICENQSETDTPSATSTCIIQQDVSMDTNEINIEDKHEIIIDEVCKETEVKIDDSNLVHTSKVDDTPCCMVKTEKQYEKGKQQSFDKPKVEVSNYHLKWFDWKGEQTPIVTQNENGPCPLLAIANVLILARKINLPKMQQLISGKQLMEYIGDCILAESPKQEGNEELLLNYEQNMQDAIDIMYKLQTGIDVNVKFSSVTDFEFTPECIVFDLLKIQLYHGWLVDPQDIVHLKAVGGLSYNQLVEKMLMNKEGDQLVEGMVIEEFLSRTASQLTYHGLCELNATIQEEELCVFFRNNHFSTLYKHKGELFLLVTDQGFLTEPSVVWETLVNIEGDGQFVNPKFVSVTLQTETAENYGGDGDSGGVGVGERTMSQEDRDYLIALSLQQDVPAGTHQSTENIEQMQSIDGDYELALKLQEDENRLAQQQQQQQQQKQAKQKQDVTQPQQPQQQQQQQHPAASQSSNLRYGQQAGTHDGGVSQQQQQQQQHHQQQQQQQPQRQPDDSQQQQQQQQERDKVCSIL